MNYERMVQQAQQQQSTAEPSPFIPMREGVMFIRPLPVGNYEEDLGFKVYAAHTLTRIANGKRIPINSICWNYIFATERSRATLATPLNNAQKLTEADFRKYQQFNCPFCAAMLALDAAGFDKQFSKVLWAAPKALWNVVLRTQDPKNAADTCYVWKMSNKNHEQLISTGALYYQNGVQIFDVQTGFDWQLEVRGQNLQRKYGLTPMAFPRPVMNVTPYNLNDIIARYEFKDYQAQIDMLKDYAGQALAQIGYTIPGDTSFFPTEVVPQGTLVGGGTPYIPQVSHLNQATDGPLASGPAPVSPFLNSQQLQQQWQPHPQYTPPIAPPYTPPVASPQRPQGFQPQQQPALVPKEQMQQAFKLPPVETKPLGWDETTGHNPQPLPTAQRAPWEKTPMSVDLWQVSLQPDRALPSHEWKPEPVVAQVGHDAIIAAEQTPGIPQQGMWQHPTTGDLYCDGQPLF